VAALPIKLIDSRDYDMARHLLFNSFEDILFHASEDRGSVTNFQYILDEL